MSSPYPNTVVALGYLCDEGDTAYSLQRYDIVDPANERPIAYNLMAGDEPLASGTPVLVIALPGVESARIQWIMRAVQAAKYDEGAD